jgi:HEAT repeat protein
MNYKSLPCALVLAACCLFTIPTCAQDNEIDTLLQEFKGESAAIVRSPAELATDYNRVLDALLPEMNSTDTHKQGAALEAWQRIGIHAARPGAEAARNAVVSATILKLTPNIPATTRLYLLKLVERVGRAEAVPVLATALNDNDPVMRDAARRALQSNPSAEAGTILRTALERAVSTSPATQQLDNDSTIGLINAVGYRRDTASITTLTKLLGGGSRTASAAIAALGKIGGSEAVGVLRKYITITKSPGDETPVASVAQRSEVIHAVLQAADGMARTGTPDERAEAKGIFEYYYRPDYPQAIRVAALRGLVMTRGNEATPLLLEAMTGSDVAMQNIASRLVSEIPGREATAAFASLLPRLPDSSKATLLDELSARGDVTARVAVLEQVKSTTPEVRIAALRALGSLGGPIDSVMLARIASTTQGRERDAAREGVARLRSTTANEVLLQALQASSTPSALRIEVIRGLSSRRATVATPVLLQTIRSKDVAVQHEAIAALGVLGDEKIAAPLVNLLVTTASGATRVAAAQALANIYDRRRNKGATSTPVLAALPKANAAARVQLVGLLPNAGDAGALQAARAALKDSNAEVRDAAVRSLAEWPDSAPLQDLLTIARNDKDMTHRVLALRGYVRLSGSGERLPAERIQLLQAALGVAGRTEEKKLVLGALGNVPDVAAVQVVQPFLTGETTEEAAAAILKIANALSKDSNATESVLMELRPVLTTVAQTSRVSDTSKDAVQLLASLDDQASRTWLVCGPFPMENDEQFERPFAPEQSIDLEARYDTTIGKKQYVATWREIRAKGNKVDLANFYPLTSGNIVDHAFIYALGYVYSPTERRVKLAVGSDDGVRVWLNDALVWSNHIHRAAKMDEDVTDATLRAGWNKVLLKLENNTADWQFFFRIADDQLRPLPELKLATEPVP